jgi:DUF4097 and DUF4098 domain-containing protein YvlB
MAYKQLRPSLLGALLWMGLGILFLFHNFNLGPDTWSLISHYWPVLLILLGVAKILDYFLHKESISIRIGELIGIVILVMIGTAITAIHSTPLDRIFRDFQFHAFNRTPWEPGLWFEDSRKFTETTVYPVEKGLPVYIENSYGSVSVIQGRDNEIRVNLKKGIYADEARARSIADEIHLQGTTERVDAGKTGSPVFAIRTNRESLNSKNYRFNTDLEVYVPGNSQVRIKNSFGNIRVSEVNGNLNLNAAQSNIDIVNCTGEFTIFSRFGENRLRNLTGKVYVDARGKVHAETIHGDLNITDEFSPIEVMNVDGKVSISTTNGNIRLDNISKPVDIHAHGARVSARQLQETLNVDADHSYFDLWNIDSSVQIKSLYTTIYLKDIRGNLNFDSNSDMITASVVRGNIRLKARATGATVNDLQGNADIQTSLKEVVIRGLEGDCLVANEYGGISISVQKLFKLIQVKNHSGKIDMFLPESATFGIIATAQNGDVSSNHLGLPGAIRESNTMVLRSPIKSGDPKILLDTDYGNIRISRIHGSRHF